MKNVKILKMNKNTLLSGVQRFPVKPSSLIGQYTKLCAILFLVKRILLLLYLKYTNNFFYPTSEINVSLI